MEATYSFYDFNKSIDRISEILNASDSLYEEKDYIPSRDLLTFSNGFYVNCSALFVDIRGSKLLNEKHRKPTLAKIYKTYISEIIAVLRGNQTVHEIFIEGDCVWAIFNTPNKSDVNHLFETAACVSSLIEILNIKYCRKSYSALTVGIGLSYGQSLYIKSGYKGSGINEAVWIGKLVSEAAKICSYGNKTYDDKEMMVSDIFYNNLSDDYKKMLSKNYNRSCYHGKVINLTMNEWVKKNS